IPNCTLHIQTGQDGTYDQNIPYVVNSSVTLASGIVVLMGDFGLPTILTGLKRTTQYYFKVSNASGETNTILLKYNNNVDTTRPAPSGIAVNASNDSATISWVSEAGATNSVEWGTSTNYGNTPVAATSGAAPTATLTNLNGNTTYYFRVKSTDINGNTGYGILMTSSPVGTFRTASINVHGALEWAQKFGNSSSTLRWKAISVNTAGEIAVGGHMQDVWTVGNGQTLPDRGGVQVGVVAKLNSSGVVQWARQFYAPPQVTSGVTFYTLGVNAVKMLEDGSVLVGGGFGGVTDFGGTSLTQVGSPGTTNAAHDGFIAKYSAGSYGVPGALSWVKQLGGIYEDQVWSIDVDASNNILVAATSQSASVDCGNGITATGTTDMEELIVKINSSGV